MRTGCSGFRFRFAHVVSQHMASVNRTLLLGYDKPRVAGFALNTSSPFSNKSGLHKLSLCFTYAVNTATVESSSSFAVLTDDRQCQRLRVASG